MNKPYSHNFGFIFHLLSVLISNFCLFSHRLNYNSFDYEGLLYLNLYYSEF